MHGLRKIDARSVGKYKQDPEKVTYLQKIRPLLGETLDWVAATFGYETEIAKAAPEQ